MIRRKGAYVPNNSTKSIVADISSVVFSFWTSTLDVIEAALERKGIPCVRIDGNVAHGKRNAVLKTFRENQHVRVALLTISCGAVG
jgi:SNF2 family DNA or RNA helicase